MEDIHNFANLLFQKSAYRKISTNILSICQIEIGSGDKKNN